MSSFNLAPYNLTWTCHVCGDKRPDHLISVHKMIMYAPGGMRLGEHNVRYCNDRIDCESGARNISFVANTDIELREPR